MSSRRISGRQPKPKSFSDEEPPKKIIAKGSTNGKNIRSCEKAGCIATEPICILNCTEQCAKSGYTSRWYHLSLGEHFCNNCFDHFYRTTKGGNAQFTNWNHLWGNVAKATKPTIKTFIANKILPYWISCTRQGCWRWRKMYLEETIDSEYIKNFTCELSASKKCSEVEESEIDLVLDPTFMSQMAEKPLLKQSPAAPYLVRFLAEDIGMDPIDSGKLSLEEQRFIEPFLMEQCGQSSIWVKPGIVDTDEIDFVQRVDVSFQTFFGLRNLIIAVWNLTPREWLTVDKIHPHLICRGLVRIYLISVAAQLIDLLTKKAVINHGIIENPSLKLKTKLDEPRILVIGAGISGLAAAAHLHNLGLNVTVFEAGADLGGRIKDVPILGSGAFLVQGLTNNPLSILSIQAKAEFQTLSRSYVLFKADGEVVSDDVIRKTQEHLDGLLQGAVESAEEKPIKEIIEASYKQLSKVTPYCQHFEVLQHLLTLKEIKLHTKLTQLSPLNLECPVSVQGEEGFLPNGLGLLLSKLSRDIDIHYNHEVISIDYSGEKIIVKTPKKESTFSQVLVTVPLPLLQKEQIQFHPPLPKAKKNAIQNLQPWYVEMLLLEFPNKFWNKKKQKPIAKFSIMSGENIPELFVDVTGANKPTLMAYISESSAATSDEEILDKSMALLKSVFGPGTPSPSKWHLSHWKNHPFGGNFGSHPMMGHNAEAYDEFAAAVDDKLYFGGEATFRHLPGTVAGAYLSGLREAAKIVTDLEL